VPAPTSITCADCALAFYKSNAFNVGGNQRAAWAINDSMKLLHSARADRHP
jgi:hypothetical protein